MTNVTKPQGRFLQLTLNKISFTNSEAHLLRYPLSKPPQTPLHSTQTMDENGGDAMETETNTTNGTAGKCLSSFVDDGTVESHRYYLSRRTLLEMLRDRGYDVSNSEIDLTLRQFRDLHGQDIDVDRLRISASHVSDPENKVLAVFCGTGVVKVNSIRWIATQIMNKESLSRLIIVVQNHITNQAQKAVDLFPFKVEIFQITDLLVNITKHVLKPKHRVMTDKEKEKLLKKFNLDEKQLPRMSQKDAIAQYYALEKGQVIEVTYNGEITGLHVTYRCIW
ncbi:putative DNA-directed RNA polymerase [Helianthus annuus]|uniref:DNA-directed RNA polymerase n=2 Tax=Helianthus annuus TaxID=4232 RepID=A0A251TW81_HELAN|nr:putative DNA-directed RNA polymerase [Helianthus annuus]KAJ0947188.1 putative DNA-directed RNA polymerase [Helianthus annuus]